MLSFPINAPGFNRTLSEVIAVAGIKCRHVLALPPAIGFGLFVLNYFGKL